MKFLLDTNVISEIRKRDRAHPNVVHWVTRTPVEDIGTSVLVLAEIRHGLDGADMLPLAIEWGSRSFGDCLRVGLRRLGGFIEGQSAAS